jgi:uncharacterized membrane protein
VVDILTKDNMKMLIFGLLIQKVPIAFVVLDYVNIWNISAIGRQLNVQMNFIKKIHFH